MKHFFWFTRNILKKHNIYQIYIQDSIFLDNKVKNIRYKTVF